MAAAWELREAHGLQSPSWIGVAIDGMTRQRRNDHEREIFEKHEHELLKRSREGSAGGASQ